MSKIIKVNCNSSTTIDMIRPEYSNTTGDKLIVGTHYLKTNLYNIFVSVLKFNPIDIKIEDIESVSLYLYLDNLLCNDLSFKNIAISKNIDNPDLNKISWKSPPKISKNHYINVCFPYSYVDSFIDIDITSLYKSSKIDTEDFSITLSSCTNKNTSIVRFDSAYSINKPYLVIRLRENIYDDIPLEYTDEYSIKSPPYNSNSSCPFRNIDFSKLNKLEESTKILTKEIASIKTNISDLNKKYTNLNNAIKDITSKNNRISDIELTKNNLKSITDTVSSLKDEVKSLNSRLNSISIEPILDE